MRSRCCFVICLLLSVFPCIAQTKAAPAPSGSADLSKEAWIIEHVLNTINVEDSGRDVREVTAEIKLLAEAGVKQFAVLNFTYTSANETVDVDYVRVRKPDGTVVKTPDYNIQDMPADITRTAPLYSDIHEKHVAVKGLGVGDVLEYRIRYRTLTPQVPGQVWYAFNMTSNQIVRDERVELTVPREKRIMVKSPEFKPEVVEQGNARIYKWKHANLRLKEEEETASRRSNPPPDVQVSTFASWEDVGNWYQQLQKEQVAVTPAITAKATELTKGLTTDDQKLRAIYDFVSLRVHYIGLDFGIGRYQPHAAEEVLGNEYGDCKDKHTLLTALLKATGFDAWPALIHISQKLDPDVPSLAQFDHVITVVPRGKELIWLDTTAEVAPYGLLIPQLRDKQALVMATGKPPVLMSTPANSPFPQEQRFTATAKLGADGVLKGHISQRYRGDVELVLRLALRQIPEAKWKDAVQNFSRGIGFAGDVSNVVISPVEDLDKPLEISYDYYRKDFADWEHKQILALVPPVGIESAGFRQKAPKEPVYLGAVGDLVYHSEIELPPGSSLMPPKDRDLVEPYAEYHTQNVLEGGKLKTTRRLVLKKTEVPVADWEGFKKMSKAVSEDSFNYMPLSGLGDGVKTSAANISELDAKFREATEALQQRDTQRAKELLQQIIAAEPKYHGAHFDLAIALAGAGGMNEALEEFQKEEEITPDDPRPYHAAAALAAATFRRDVAIAQLRKLLKVDPSDREGALQLSSLLSADGKYVESAEVLEKAVERSPESPSLQFSLGNAYAKSGDTTKAVPHLRAAADAAEKSSEIDYMQLNNVAYTLTEANAELDLAKHCIEKALQDLDKRSSSASGDGSVRLKLTRDYSYLWDTAGWLYFKLGDATTAESYVRASWLLGQQGIVGEHLAQIYERLGRNKEAAHTYELAYEAMQAVPSARLAVPGLGSLPSENQAAQERAKTRYQKLTGKPINRNVIERLPNGKWPVTPTVELSQMREAKLGSEPGPNDSADFEITFAPESTTANFLSGSTQMKSMKKRVEAAKFRVEIPAGSKAALYRHVTVHCSKWAPCSAVLLPLDTVSPNVTFFRPTPQ